MAFQLSFISVEQIWLIAYYIRITFFYILCRSKGCNFTEKYPIAGVRYSNILTINFKLILCNWVESSKAIKWLLLFTYSLLFRPSRVSDHSLLLSRIV